MDVSFLDIYDRSFDDVYRYVMFKVGNKWDADDIVSAVFAKAYQGHEKLRGDPRAWVFTIARHAVIDFYRKKGKEIPKADLTDLCATSEAETIESEAEAACLRQALDQLDSEQRELISLRYFSSLQHKQIAKALGKTEASVKMRISRILERVRGMVQTCMM